ncbi:hypothetical protein WGQ_03939 [Escherichia coli KTE232]|nr:hypothetical protein A15Y_04046 [Escherichia coli KTE212]ELJ53170.1 hypothetical protein WGQ_03939 [Escherichia coli KTE232]
MNSDFGLLSDLNIRSQPVSGLHAVTFKCDSATILPPFED